MAPSRSNNVGSEKPRQNKKTVSKKEISNAIISKADLIIGSRKSANEVFDIFEYLQVENERDVTCAVHACSRIFCTLLERGDLFVGTLPNEDELLAGNFSAGEKYCMFMRHRYNNCVELMLDLLGHESYQVKESSLCTIMKFVSVEGHHPLDSVDWDCHYNFPRELLKAVVTRLLSEKEDMSLLISRFQEFLEKDDVRYYVMGAVSDCVCRVMERAAGAVLPVYQNNVFVLLSNINMPKEESELNTFLVEKDVNRKDWKAIKLKEHRRVFERMWLGFLKHKLPSNMYKKVLVMLHDSILTNMSQPTLMIDFLTSAYDIGGAISLLALNGLFVLIHQHNLDYPDFYKKLYTLLEPSIFHVKYRGRFFHLADIFLSSSHLPVYLVAAFTKRLARLALTAPPAGLLVVLPFIYNLVRRHPSCRVLIHRPSAEPCDDPYLMEEVDPALCHALESSLWELQTLQKHYHPEVSKAAARINRPLPELEDGITELLDLSAYELFEQDLQQPQKQSVPLEFEPITQLLQGSASVLVQHFSLN